MKQITIYEFLKKNEGVIKDGWVAMDLKGNWGWYEEKPFIYESLLPRGFDCNGHITMFYSFNIAPFDGDWKDSLIKVEHKEEEE